MSHVKSVHQVGRLKINIMYDSEKITVGNKNIPTNPVDVEAVSQWLRSDATPGVWTMS